MSNIDHLKPVMKTIFFGNKVLLARKRAASASLKVRQNVSRRYPSVAQIVLINIIQLLAVAAVVTGIVLWSTTLDENSIAVQNQNGTTQPGTTNPNGGVTPTNPDIASNDPSSLISRTTSAILKYKGVSNFSDIRDKNDPLSKVKTITESKTGKITIRLSATYSDVTRTQLRDSVHLLMNAIKDQIPDLDSLIIVTSDNYFMEPATRTN